MQKIVEVRLRESGQIFPFISDIDVKCADIVIVEQERGIDWGQVISEIEFLPDEEAKNLKRILRKATPQDLHQIEENRKSVSSAMKVCESKIKKHNLVMKLVGAEYVFDRTKIIFYFTAEGRVDFRELVKDLAKIFKIRIEMRQIGVRDEARFFGGYGICGRQLCCTSFLKNFVSVSIKLAKDQQLPLNPQKISGVCGRLMCCLSYEYEMYKELLDKMCKIGDKITLPEGKGKVVSLNPLKGTVNVETEDGKIIEHKVL